MTGLQQRVLHFIAAFISQHGRSPTLQQIADGVGLRTRSGVHRIVLLLEQESYIARAPRRPCSLEVTVKGSGSGVAMIAIPLDLRSRLERRAHEVSEAPASLAAKAIAAYLDASGGCAQCP